MGDTLITVVAIFLAAVVMFIFPMMAIADNNDSVSGTVAQTIVTDAVNQIVQSGKISIDDYDRLVQSLGATGNTYEVEVEISLADQNMNVKTAQTNARTIGETSYYTMFTSQILPQLEEVDPVTGEIISTPIRLKQGDTVTIRVDNTNKTIGQIWKSFVYKVSGNDTSVVHAEHTSIVPTNGNSTYRGL